MLKHASLYIFLLLFNFRQLAAQGIQFTNADLPTALNTAKQQNKLVFIDMYTDWCGPCKQMEKEIFPQEKVGQLYNDNFISCRINAEKDGGPDIAKKYEVTAYPTFLFLTPDGELIAKGIGYNESPDPFLEVGRSAIRKKGLNYSVTQMRNNYEKNKNDKQFLATYIERLDSLDLKKEVAPALDQYCKIIGKPSGADYNLLLKHVYKANSTAFDFLLDNQATAYKYFNPDSLFPDKKGPKSDQFEGLLNNVIIETIVHAIDTKDQQEFSMVMIKDRKIDHQAPKFPLSRFAFSAQFYKTMKDTVSLLKQLQHFSDTLLPSIFPIASSTDSLYARNMQNPDMKGSYIRYLANTINSAADKYLLYSKKNSDFQKALTLSQQSLTLLPNTPIFLNTGARSYYLLNNKEKAIQLQKQAIEYSKDTKSLRDKFVSELADMQAGKKII